MDRLLELTYRAEQTHFWFRGFRQYITPAIARATTGLNNPRILDCGCGTGSNLELLERYGHAFGFDLTRIGTEFAKTHGHAIAQASLSHMPFADATFDLVTSFDVLQVVPDAIEQAGISEMVRVAKPGGWLLLHVAALQILYGRHSVLSQEHRRYTATSLRRLVEDAGFRIERLTYDHLTLMPMMLPVRVWQRLTASGEVEAGEAEITPPIAPVNAALTALVSLEALALRGIDMPIGCSLMCLAQKPS